MVLHRREDVRRAEEPQLRNRSYAGLAPHEEGLSRRVAGQAQVMQVETGPGRCA